MKYRCYFLFYDPASNNLVSTCKIDNYCITTMFQLLVAPCCLPVIPMHLNIDCLNDQFLIGHSLTGNIWFIYDRTGYPVSEGCVVLRLPPSPNLLRVSLPTFYVWVNCSKLPNCKYCYHLLPQLLNCAYYAVSCAFPLSVYMLYISYVLMYLTATCIYISLFLFVGMFILPMSVLTVMYILSIYLTAVCSTLTATVKGCYPNYISCSLGWAPYSNRPILAYISLR